MVAPRISYDYFGIQPSFATATGLRDALLASYPDAEFFGGPITGVRVGYDYDTAPAWGWVKRLLRTRTDWWPAVGLALQHAAQDGGATARRALADLLATCEESVVLLEWTGPVARQWPDTRTSGSTGHQVPDGRLDDLVDRQRVRSAELQRAPITIPGMPDGDAKTEADLVSLLALSINKITHGPWYWLVSELVHHPWMRPLMPAVCERFSGGDNRELRAMLDWLCEEHDLWRHFELLDEWSRHEPAWWNDNIKPGRGRRSPLRAEVIGAAKILGHLVWRARACALLQRGTPPVVDLAEITRFHGSPRATVKPHAPPPPPTPPPTPMLARASLHEAGPRAPAPAVVFTQHRAAIVQLLVLGRERVVSVDSDRVALVWNPQTAALIARHELPANAIACSLTSTDSGLVYVVQGAEQLAVHALDGHRVLAHVARRDLPAATIASCNGDLSRVLLAGDGELVLVPLVGGGRLVRKSVETHDPEVLAVAPTGGDYLVRFHHVGMDMYPTDEQAVFDGSTLKEIDRRRGHVDVRSPLSSHPTARVEIGDAFARVFVADDRPLPDLVAHARPICMSAWLDDDALLTADIGGKIHRWDVDRMIASPGAPAQHAEPITHVRFTRTGVVSFTAKDTKLWRDGAQVATLPALTAPTIDPVAQTVFEVDATAVRTYSLVDGAALGAHAAATPGSMDGARVVGPGGRISVYMANSYPTRVASLRDDHERLLPPSLAGILPEGTPPILHAGRLLLTQYIQYKTLTRSVSCDTFAVFASRVLHVDGGTAWTTLHPDGVTLYSAGYTDGKVSASDFLTLDERDSWTVFRGAGSESAISTAVLLPVRGWILVAGWSRLRRFELDRGLLARMIRDPVDCASPQRVEELVADAAERRVVVFLQNGAAQVIDVDHMAWVDAHDGEIDAARARRSVALDSKARGFERAFVCGQGRHLVGWSFGLAITSVSAERALRAPFLTRVAPKADTLRGALVDEALGELWLLCKDGTLVRTSLVHDAPIETVTTIAGGVKIAWTSRSTFAVQTEAGALHYLRTSGECICTVAGLMPAQHAPRAFAESVAVCAQPDGAVRVAEIPGDSYRTLRDARATMPATAIAVAAPFFVSRHGNQVLRWDLRAGGCTGAWTASTTLTAIDVREDGAVLVGEANGVVTLLQ